MHHAGNHINRTNSVLLEARKRLHSLPEIILHRIQEGSGSIREEVVKNSGLDLTKDQEPREPRLDTRKDEELGLAKFSRRGFKFS